MEEDGLLRNPTDNADVDKLREACQSALEKMPHLKVDSAEWRREKKKICEYKLYLHNMAEKHATNFNLSMEYDIRLYEVITKHGKAEDRARGLYK
ncbi:unnamed protein product [Rodentolepis nana]|uniref:XRN2-binding (XTBD) domain-containing protein n=1 Tax=Rodentolepis nana TaxID=102285 RepID=A0A0R3TGP4_RODNA|nr:unnamed protein product [Rodentolepis nana]